MSSNLKKMLFLNISSSIVTIYVNIFINLFIWEKNNDVGEVALFNLISYFFLFVIYVFGSYLLTKNDLRFLMFLSSFFAIITFSILLFVQFENELLQIILVALNFAATKGFYYSGANFSVSVFGKNEEEFANYFSIQAILKLLINVFVPILGAFVIFYYDYKTSFMLMLLFSSLMLFISFTIPKVNLPKVDSFFLKLTYRKVFVEKKFHYFALSSFAIGIFSKFLIFFTLIFTFSITENKFYIALLNIVYVLLTFLALKIMKKNNKVKNHYWLFIGFSFVVFGCLLIVFLNSSVFVLLANILFTLGLFYFDNVNKTQHFGFIVQFDDVMKSRLLIWREILLGISRSTLLIFVLFIDNPKGILFVSILIFSLLIGFLIPFINNHFVPTTDEPTPLEK